MKNFTQLRWFTILAFVLLSFAACEKEGPMGPAGPKGETGAGEPGPKGDKGDTGGFTFKEFIFDQVTIPAGIGTDIGLDFAVTKEEFEKSLTMLYLSAGNNNDNWLVMPGIGTGGVHEYRLWYAFVEQGTMSRAILKRVAGPTTQAQTYTKARIIVIPLESAAAMQAAGINLNNSKEVKAALKLD